MGDVLEGIKKFAESTGMLPPPPEAERVQIHVGRDLAVVARRFGDALAEAPLFRRDGLVVYVDEMARAIRRLDTNDFQTRVQRWCLPYKAKPKDDDLPKEETISDNVARVILKNEGFIHSLRGLSRVNPTRMPAIRKDGALVLLPPGYDAENESWTLDSGVVVREDADPEWAAGYLRNLLKDFPFSDEHGRSMSCHLAAMLTLFVPNMLGDEVSRPAFVYTANAPGSGKTLLSQMAIVSTVGTAAGTTMPRTDEQLVQVLHSAALSAAPYLFFDNCEGVINPPQLSAFITMSDWGVRLMHTQQLVESTNVSTCFLTGNDFVVKDDLERRSFFVDMFVEDIDQSDREIENPISVGWLKAKKNRGDILSAMWGLIRKWNADGRPGCPRKRSSFEDWSAVVGGILVANGFCDPHEAPELTNSGNTEKADMVELVTECMGDSAGQVVEYDFGALMTLARRNGWFGWVLPPIDDEDTLNAPDDASEQDDHSEINKEINQAARTKFGKMLRKWSDGGRKYRTAKGDCLFGVKGKKRHSKFQFRTL